MRGKENMKRQTHQPRAMKKLYALGEKRSIDLSLSENPLGCSPMVASALKKVKVNFNDYPQPNGALLKQVLANKFNLKAEDFFVANGSESIIRDIPRVFSNVGDEAVMPLLTFPLFKVCSELAGLRPILVKMTDQLKIDLAAIADSISSQTSLVFICNPNNPTGDILSKNELIKLFDLVPKSTTLVVDEANIEFGGESIIKEIRNRKNLIVLRIFSKGFGLANLRIGFAVASQRIIQRLEEETQIFPVSGLSELLAKIALADTKYIEQTKRFVDQERLIMKRELKKIGFIVFSSETNNLFVKIPDRVPSAVFLEKIRLAEVSLIPGSSFDGFDDCFFRVSIRTRKTNQKFLEAMRLIVEKNR